jgi:hypothetical protein
MPIERAGSPSLYAILARPDVSQDDERLCDADPFRSAHSKRSITLKSDAVGAIIASKSPRPTYGIARIGTPQR